MTDKKYTLNIEMPGVFGVSVYCDRMNLSEVLETDDSLVKSVEGFIEGNKVFVLRVKKDPNGKVDIKIDGI